MPPIINAQGLTKSYGASPLFRDIAFTISEGDRIGLIGPNGSGKSTLLGILAGQIEPDRGEVALRKRTRLSHVVQDSRFSPGSTVRSVIKAALERASVPDAEREARLAETLGRTGFEDFDLEASSLSGGWKKRLAIAEALVQATRYSASRRAHQSPRSGGHRVAGSAARERSLRLRGGQPRSLLS